MKRPRRRPRDGLRPSLVALAMCAAACGEAEPPGPWIVEGDGVRWREIHPEGDGGFTPLDAPDRGIEFVYDVDEERRYENRILVEGAGVAVGDVDGDGLADLFFAGLEGPSRLYRNAGGWRFEDVTAEAGVALDGVPVRGAALADVDGDGDLDLLATVHGAPNRLLRNDGDGRFTIDPDAGFRVARGSTTPALADVDGDGDLDLYIANYKTRQADDALSDAERAGLDRLRPGPDGAIRVPPVLAEHYRVDFDGRFVRWWELGERDEFYLNDGSGRFVEARLDERLPGAIGEAAGDSLRDWGLVARFSDWDADGDPDLYVANDFNSADGIWLNLGDGFFEAAPIERFRSTSLSSMAVAIGDVERDGDLDIVTTDMLARDPVVRLTQRPAFEPDIAPPGETAGRIQLNRNALQLNRGDGTFAETAWAAGLAASDWTWGALFLDVDLDGYEDLLVTTGHVWDQLDADADERLRTAPGSVDWRRELSLYPALRQPNVAFRGLGDGRFEEAGELWSWSAGPDISHGLATGDLDADGDLDVIVTRFGEPPLLMRNDAVGPRVLVRLEGPAGNTAGVGARVTAAGHAAGPQIDEIVAGGSYLSSSEPALSFAAPEDGSLSLTVDWPDGRRTDVGDARPNREYVIPWQGSSAPGPTTGAPAAPDPLFEDITERLSHAHADSPFDDRARQPLVPRSMSRSGPGVSWIDFDEDGDADLLVGSGGGGAPVIIENRDGAFATPRALTDPLPYDVTTMLEHRAPGGALRILLGISNYEAASPEETLARPAVVSVGPGSGRGMEPVLAGAPPTTGPLARADIDSDGDLDVFVGGAGIPTQIPRPSSSRILVNEGGILTFDGALSAPFHELGVVSGAVFTDIDGDADPDLALAPAWGQVRLFRNDGGRFTEAIDVPGLSEPSGRWNAIAAGDFDGDGAQDLVVTGWGDNTGRRAEYSIFHGDFDRNGQYDFIEAVRTADGWRPLRRRDELQVGIPAISRLPFAALGETPLERLLGPTLEAAARIDLGASRHAVLLNRGGRFEARPLPDEAQWAPSFGVAVADLDGDGREDIFLSQNFSGGTRGDPRHDAGRGLVLTGDGAGGFRAVPAVESGIAVYGDGRAAAAADFDLDGRVDLAVGVNGGATRLFRNVRATPGLRVRLAGPPDNPDAIGAVVRVLYEDGSEGPAREIRSGEGHWSRNESPQTLGLGAAPAAVRVRWPDGSVSEHRVGVGERSMVVESPRD